VNLGEIRYRKRQDPKRCRYFILTEHERDEWGFEKYKGFHVRAYDDKIHPYYLSKDPIIVNNQIDGFERKSIVLTEDEIARDVLLGRLNARFLQIIQD
jgi:hypothetical protein